MDPLVRYNGSYFDLGNLGLTLTNKTQYDLLPSLKTRRLQILGKHGSIVLGDQLDSRSIELEFYMTAETEELFIANKKTLTQILDPSKGPQEWVFSNEPDRAMLLHYSGSLRSQDWITDSKINLPMKMSDPYVYDKDATTLSGNGQIVNDGDFPTYVTISIAGPATDPAVTIGSQSIVYSDNLGADQTLVIDTKEMTAKVGLVNVLPVLTGFIDEIPIGTHSINCSSGSLVCSWKRRWL